MKENVNVTNLPEKGCQILLIRPANSFVGSRNYINTTMINVLNKFSKV